MLPHVVSLSSATFGCVYAPSVPKKFREEKVLKPGKIRQLRAPSLPAECIPAHSIV
jgi:hypothetical protein